MTSLIPIGVISMVIAFLISVMGGNEVISQTFSAIIGPSIETQATSAQIGVSGTQAVANEMATKFLGGYTSILDGLMAYQDNPDYEKAEATRQELVAFAESLVSQFPDLVHGLQE